jgi:hypothetical protein
MSYVPVEVNGRRVQVISATLHLALCLINTSPPLSSTLIRFSTVYSITTHTLRIPIRFDSIMTSSTSSTSTYVSPSPFPPHIPLTDYTAPRLPHSSPSLPNSAQRSSPTPATTAPTTSRHSISATCPAPPGPASLQHVAKSTPRWRCCPIC